jgi:hypothetical protein
MAVYHRSPSGPLVILMPFGVKGKDTVNSVSAPAGVSRPIRNGPVVSVNHRFPSGPTVMLSPGKELQGSRSLRESSVVSGASEQWRADLCTGDNIN